MISATVISMAAEMLKTYLATNKNINNNNINNNDEFYSDRRDNGCWGA